VGFQWIPFTIKIVNGSLNEQNFDFFAMIAIPPDMPTIMNQS
jgi:menaquinone-dependent protoporphyrinogen IX oxidase